MAIPLEITVGLVSAVGGFAMKLMAQRHADNVAMIKLGMEQVKATTESANAAARRSSPWLRKFAAIIVLTVAFVGLLGVAFVEHIPVSIVQQMPQNSLLWGLFTWGDTIAIIPADGFVIGDWFKYSVISIIHFLFGTGAAKVSR